MDQLFVRVNRGNNEIYQSRNSTDVDETTVEITCLNVYLFVLWIMLYYIDIFSKIRIFFFSFYCLYACLFVIAFASIHPLVYRFIIHLNIFGRLSVSKIEELPDDNWEDDLTVNLTAPFMVIKQLLGSMKEKGNE